MDPISFAFTLIGWFIYGFGSIFIWRLIYKLYMKSQHDPKTTYPTIVSFIPKIVKVEDLLIATVAPTLLGTFSFCLGLIVLIFLLFKDFDIGFKIEKILQYEIKLRK